MRKTTTLLITLFLASPFVLQSQINLSKTAVWIGTPGAYPTGLGWSDIDGNGSPDLVVSCGLDVSEAPVAIFFNDNGTLQSTAGWISGYRSANGCLYLGDLNNDGSQDVAVASLGITSQGLPPENHAIFFNNGGFPANPDWISPPGNGFSCTGGDVDGDGDIDMVFGQGDWLTSHLQKTKLFVNNGGNFDTIPSWESDSSFYVDEVVFGDVDMDGYLDLAIGNERTVGNVGIAIFKNIGGVLETTPSWHSDSVVGGRQMAFGDSDGDGYPELAVASPTQKFYLFDNKNGILDTIPCWSSNCTVNEPSAVAWVDADGDGDLDLSTGSWFSKAGIFENIQGALTDTFAWSVGAGSGTQQVAWGDYEKDGLMDTTALFQGDGLRKLFYPGRQPLEKITSVTSDGITLPLSQYCYDLLNGWVSLSFAPGPGVTVSIGYTYSRDPDMALSNWGAVKLYKNLNTATGINDRKRKTTGSILGPNFPEPLQTGTSFPLTVKSPGICRLFVYNFQGKIIKTLFDGYRAEGKCEIFWDGTDQHGNNLPDGIYFCRFISGNVSQSEKVMICR
ncbi:MAG: FG-GAP-like repeat-containing protein [bacterium]